MISINFSFIILLEKLPEYVDPTATPLEFKSNNLINEPYLLLQVEEVGGIYILIILMFIMHLQEYQLIGVTGRESLLRLSIFWTIIKRFYPTPLASLSTLTVQFVTKNGCLFDFLARIILIFTVHVVKHLLNYMMPPVT